MRGARGQAEAIQRKDTKPPAKSSQLTHEALKPFGPGKYDTVRGRRK